MKLKFLTVVALVALVFTSCGGDAKKEGTTNETPAKQETKKAEPKKDAPAAKMDLTAPTLDNKGIGPIKSVTIADKIDEAMAAKGKELYKTNCTACHKFKKRYVGPALKGVTQRRSPEWIMNMILNSMEMLEKDPVAKALIAEYHAPMAQQSLKEDEARAVLEYFRTKN